MKAIARLLSIAIAILVAAGCTSTSKTGPTINQLMADRGLNVPPYPMDAYHVFDEGLLPVSDGHLLHYSQAGNPQGPAVVFAHGGPGGGATDGARGAYNPDFYRIVLVDQRGAGKSKAPPEGLLHENTMPKIVEDMEALRKHIGVEKWILSGGSSGSTVALLYAIAHPDRVLAMNVHGITFLTRAELKWTGWVSSDIWADEWHRLKNLRDENGKRILSKEDVSSFNAFVTAGYREVVEKKNRKFAFAVLNMGMRQTQIDPHGPEINIAGDRAFRMAQIIWHMWYHRFFLPKNYVRENLHKIKDIPGFIEAGRYDTNTVLKSAWELHMAWPKASLLIYTGAHADTGVYNRWSFRVLESALRRWQREGKKSLSITREDFEREQWSVFRKSLDAYYLKPGLDFPQEKQAPASVTKPTGF